MTEEKMEVSASNGWLHGRLAMEDLSSGTAEVGPGLDFSIRLCEISMYHVATLGVLHINTATGASFHIIGSLEAMRGIMARENIREA